MKKVGIIGSGNVGTNAAFYIAEKRVANVHLIDVVEGLAEGKALDLMEAAPIRGYDVEIRGSSSPEDLTGSDVVVVAAGKVRLPGMKREDVLEENAGIVAPICREITRWAPESIVVVVTEPVDTMTHLVLKQTGFDPRRVMGVAGVLDGVRLRYFIARKLGISPLDVTAMVLAGHHDYMVPVFEYCRVAGIPVKDLLSEKELGELQKSVRNAGGEIVSHLKTGSAFDAAAASVAEMVEVIVRDKKRILSAPAYVQGEYGIEGICLGVPILLGARGIERIFELELTDEETAALKVSASVLEGMQREFLTSLGLN
ncbi:MAG: malate dehydrogenase [Deltaproteobacteria bacterium]|nr:malate dehydrogenase [Deltaproteobacteria bacterium]MBW2120497.1 malate dehydrogenase [Deltaproteobacteria bacterium]